MALHGTCPETQSVFRTLVDAMSRPGRTGELFVSEETGDPALGLYEVARTLMDHEVSYHVLSPRREELDARLFAITKARRAGLSEADYVVVEPCRSGGKVLQAQRGTARFPDTGATVIYLLDGSTGSPRITLRGPGIRDEIKPEMGGLDPEELGHIRRCNADYPLGVDCMFLNDRHQVMCIPRTTEIEVD